jgi:DNA polymerase epsilon subunit 4
VAQNDRLEFLAPIVPKTVTFKSVRDSAAVTRARLNGEHAEEKAGKTNGKKQKKINGGGWLSKGPAVDDDPDAQLQMEARQAAGDDDDVDMG